MVLLEGLRHRDVAEKDHKKFVQAQKDKREAEQHRIGTRALQGVVSRQLGEQASRDVTRNAAVLHRLRSALGDAVPMREIVRCRRAELEIEYVEAHGRDPETYEPVDVEQRTDSLRRSFTRRYGFEPGGSSTAAGGNVTDLDHELSKQRQREKRFGRKAAATQRA